MKPNIDHLNKYVSDVERFIKFYQDVLGYELKSKGYVDEGVQVVVKQFSRQFYIKDPDGFEIDMIQWTNKTGFYEYLNTKNRE